jgi:hypothetical protein
VSSLHALVGNLPDKKTKTINKQVMMDIDDDEATQRPREVDDYGIEIDYEDLDDEEREVWTYSYYMIKLSLNIFRSPSRMVHPIWARDMMKKYLSSQQTSKRWRPT